MRTRSLFKASAETAKALFAEQRLLAKEASWQESYWDSPMQQQEKEVIRQSCLVTG